MTTLVYFERWPHQLNQAQLDSNTENFVSRAFRSANHEHGPPPCAHNLVFIARHGSRELSDSVARFFGDKNPSLPLIFYHGNESFSETVRIFGNSQVIIGFHGAGHINAVFAPKSCVVVEITFFMPLRETNVDVKLQPAIWRTNRPGLMKLNPNLTWIAHGVYFDDVESTLIPSTNISARTKPSRIDRVLKNVKQVKLAMDDVRSIQSEIDKALSSL
jgi:hypothetical protein